jgi:uncharacterized protein (DUF2249 family)
MTQPVEIAPAAPESRGGCACGGHDQPEPVLDARTLPQAVRHGAVIGAFDSIPPGGSMILVAPHAPVPLLAQLAQRAPIDVETLVDGPTEWHVRITRRADGGAS